MYGSNINLRQRWKDRIKENLRLLEVKNAKDTAKDRAEWRHFVVEATSPKKKNKLNVS